MTRRGFLFCIMVNEFVIRIGTFFLVIGVGVFILFVASDYAGKTNFDYLFWSVLSVTIGVILRRRRPPPDRAVVCSSARESIPSVVRRR